MQSRTLAEWLVWQETLNPAHIELGLERCRTVARSMGLESTSASVITVAGTNGKGSSVAMLESIYRSAGLRTGSYTSPHIRRYNERICINGEESSDEDLCAAFARVDECRGDVPLTYFEFGTLAAFELFAINEVNIEILEVGLGGRLDAVNIRDADVALITSIGIDHVQWLGSDRNAIGHEKAGIMRPGKPVVIADPEPPRSVMDHATTIRAKPRRLGHEFDFTTETGKWEWCMPHKHLTGLPEPGLSGAMQRRNAAGVLAVVESLSSTWPVTQEQMALGLHSVHLPGRWQKLAGKFPIIADVAHNPDAIAVLGDNLRAEPVSGSTHAVFAMMADKDVERAVAAIASAVQNWHVAGLSVARAVPVDELAHRVLEVVGDRPLDSHHSVAEAMQCATRQMVEGDRLIVFGSFYTVADALSVIT